MPVSLLLLLFFYGQGIERDQLELWDEGGRSVSFSKEEPLLPLLIVFFDRNEKEPLETFYWLKDLETSEFRVVFSWHDQKGTQSFNNLPTFFEPVYLGSKNLHLPEGIHYLLFSKGRTWARLQSGVPSSERVIRMVLAERKNNTRLFVRLGSKKVVLQAYQNQCGAAAVEMVLDRMGLAVDSETIQKSLDPGPFEPSISLLKIKAFCESLALPCGGFRGQTADVKALNRPVILHVDHNHFVVLSKVFHEGALILDPALGKQFWSLERLAERWHSRVYFQIGE